MCGRYYIPEDNDYSDFKYLLDQIKERYSNTPELDSMKLGEVFPTNVVPVITKDAPKLMKWGFSGFGKSQTIINARMESAGEKPMFSRLFYSNRCLVPAGYYFEWKKDKAEKIKYAIGFSHPIYMAGLYQIEKDSRVPLFVILTRPAAADISFIHDRMPVIVSLEQRGNWLRGKDDPSTLLGPIEEDLICRAVDR